MDRLVQAALVLVLEPVFEADFKPVSYGFRPKRRCQDAIAEIHALGTRNYHWVFEADITACFDELSHTAILDRVRARISDKRVLALVKSFLKAGIMAEAGQVRGTASGTPQGGIASPLLANIALSALDEHFCARDDLGSPAQRQAHRRRGGAFHRIVRYADDFAIMVCGTKAHADALWEEVAAVLAPLGLRLSETKTRVCHIDEGFDFLGFRIQRRLRKGTSTKAVYTYPSKESLLSVMAKVRALTNRKRHATLEALLRQLNPVLRGWCAYFRHGVSKATFGYLQAFTWRRVTRWIRQRHHRNHVADLYRRFLTARPGHRRPRTGSPCSTRTGAGHPLPWRAHIPAPWASTTAAGPPPDTGNPRSAGCVETRTSGAEGGPGKRARRNPGTAPRPDPYNVSFDGTIYSATRIGYPEHLLTADTATALRSLIRADYVAWLANLKERSSL